MRPNLARLRAGSRFATLALVAVLVWLGSPLVAAGHHHQGTSPFDSDTSCSLCLWQAHQAADRVDTPRTAPLQVAPLEAAATARLVPLLDRLLLSARAPPFVSV